MLSSDDGSHVAAANPAKGSRPLLSFFSRGGASGGFSVSGVQDPVRFGIIRSLAWVLLILILCFAMLLAFIFGNRARDTLLTKQRNFAGILAEHLNQQIFVRFSIPVVASYGRQNLKQNAQYVLLDQTVASLTHGLQVYSVRIYDTSGEVKYSSINRDDVGIKSPETEGMSREVTESQRPLFTVDSNISYMEGLFRAFNMKPGAYYLRTTYPMRPVYSLKVENTASYSLAMGPSLGILEFAQDISEDMADVYRFQWSIVGITLASASLLFLLLRVFLRRAETALAQRMEEEQRLLRELHQHEKLAGMGRVVAGIAHEIRNPLGIIQSSAELLLSRPSSTADPLTGKILKAVFDEARRLSQTVSDFLDYARPRHPAQNDVDIAQSIRDVFAFLAPELNSRGVDALVSLGEGDGKLCVLGDKDLLYRAFYNILMNGIQAMNENGSLSVTGRRLTVEDRPWVELDFDDSGPGFPAEDRERFLDPFFTTKDGGTGLGLPIVNNIITSHGGTMHLEDAPGGGARVRVLLPGAAACEPETDA